MENSRVEIECLIKQDDPNKKAIAIANGTEEEALNKKTNQKYKREKWFWLPRSQVEYVDEGLISIPIWLAKDSGLI